MEIFDPDLWKRQWDVVMQAPHLTISLAISLIVVTALGAWWLCTKLEKARAQAAEERVKLAQEHVKFAQDAQTALEGQVKQLEANITSGAPRDELIRALDGVAKALESLKKTDRKLVAIMNEPVSIKSSVIFTKGGRSSS